MLDRSIVACYRTPNSQPLWNQFRDSLISAGLSAQSIECKPDRGPNPGEGSGSFGSRFWHRCVAQKVRWFSEVLARPGLSSDFVICSDIDIWFPPERASQWEAMGRYLEDQEPKVFMAAEPENSAAGKINTGFIVVPRSGFELMSGVMARVAARQEKAMAKRHGKGYPFGDQSIFNGLYQKGYLSVGIIPPEYASLGPDQFEEKASSMVFHHAIFAETLKYKTEQFAKVKEVVARF